MSSETLTTLIIAAGSALATAIGILFRMVIRLFSQQVDMGKQIGELSGRQQGVEELSKRVLDVVHAVKKCDECTEKREE